MNKSILNRYIFAGVKLKYRDLFICLCLIVLSCTPVRLIREFKNPVQAPSFVSSQNKVKVHMKDGCLYLLDSLLTFDNSDTIYGGGVYYDQNRIIIKSNYSVPYILPSLNFKIPLSDVALLETNDLKGLRGECYFDGTGKCANVNYNRLLFNKS
jgi:hypothetical protein